MCDGQIGLACTCRTDSEGDLAVVHCMDVLFLMVTLGIDGLAEDGYELPLRRSLRTLPFLHGTLDALVLHENLGLADIACYTRKP